MKLHIGTSTWSQKDWVGNFYPPHAKPATYLIEYVKRLPTVEIDSTFYAIPRRALVEGWYDKTPDDFVFSAKFPQVITHEKKLVGAGDETMIFLDTISALKEKLGCLVLQFPYTFEATLATVEAMKAYLATLPTSEFRIALEVRHASWLREGFYERLRKHNVALVLTDQPAMHGVFVETATFAYLRWLGNRKLLSEPFTELKLDKTAEMKTWAERVKAMQAETVFGYFNNHYAGHSPTSVEKFNEILNAPPPQ
jgi:uncharacterized protein YecE (DUF72 family)